jgi:hypothetical protein
MAAAVSTVGVLPVASINVSSACPLDASTLRVIADMQINYAEELCELDLGLRSDCI